MYLFTVLLLVFCAYANVHGYEREPTRYALLSNLTRSVSNILHILKDEKADNGLMKNLAYKRETYQSSTYENTAISGRAVDGISNSQWGGGSCASTNSELHPYWYVDLGKEHIIERIRITNRGDCCPERLHDVDVTVAGHDKRFDAVCGTFSGPGKASEKVVVQCPKGTKGRYVRLQITKGSNNVLTVCEVEVMGR
uniref:F-type lectin 1 n=1 Tax=Pinctada fucata TaxID=50426 RepID=I7D6W0_PINFU|nr:F-type lectin 1 [Pinctada fucata]